MHALAYRIASILSATSCVHRSLSGIMYKDADNIQTLVPRVIYSFLYLFGYNNKHHTGAGKNAKKQN